MQNWVIKKGFDRRIRAQHPWVFSNELANSPKGILPGTPVRLIDAHGNFLAWGYGNPHSLIAFRALSFNPADEAFFETEWLVNRLLGAWGLRKKIGMELSYRLCYSESDLLPGLIVDYYTVKGDSETFQVFSFQILTAGMHKLVVDAEELFESVVKKAIALGLTEIPWESTAIVSRNDSSVRSLEGLEVETARALRSPSGLNPSDAAVALKNYLANDYLILQTDFIGGQKTGLFLDQSTNIENVSTLLLKSLKNRNNKEINILDLCCYVGQWSAQLTKALTKFGYTVEVTLLDASDKSLAFAERNLKNLGAKVNVVCGDVLKDLGSLPSLSYDLIISDPPAFIKNKRDIPQGRHGYMKLNSEAFRLCTPNGLVVSCSCSGLLTEDDFSETLAKSARRSSRKVTTVARGGHAPDHPNLHWFPEGRYLKMFVHLVES